MTIRASTFRIPTTSGIGARVSPRTGSLIALVFGAVLIGMSTIASEAALRDLGPLTLAFARFMVAVAVLLAVCYRTGVRPAFGLAPTVLGISGVTCAFTFQNIGLQHINAMDATLIIEGSIPIVTTALGALLLREQLTTRRIVGLTLAVAGVATVILQGGGDTGGFSLRGGLLTLLAGGWFAVYTVAGRRAFAGEVSLPILTGSVVIGTATLLPGALYESATTGPGRFTPEAIGWVLLLGIGGSALAHVLWAHGLAHLEATEVGIIGTLMPVVGVGAAAMILSEPITIIQAGGAVLVAAGLAITTIPVRHSLRSRRDWVGQLGSGITGSRQGQGTEPRRGRAKQAS